MTPSQALQYIQGAARLNQFRVEQNIHAIVRMGERRVHMRDIAKAILTATLAVEQFENGRTRWRLKNGTDLDGVPLDVVAEINNGVLIVTVI